MSPLLVLAHGWGYDGAVWEPLRRQLPSVETLVLDLGYFGPSHLPSLPTDRPLIAVGHSLGFSRLMMQPVPWRAAVSINGFLRFTACSDFPDGVPLRMVDRMIARFTADPAAVYGDFMRRGGAPASLPAAADCDRLTEGLRWLRDADARPGPDGDSTPLLALAAPDDAIVPPAMTIAAFPGERLRWSDGGGHGLPLLRPAWCAGAIADFLDGLP